MWPSEDTTATEVPSDESTARNMEFLACLDQSIEQVPLIAVSTQSDLAWFINVQVWGIPHRPGNRDFHPRGCQCPSEGRCPLGEHNRILHINIELIKFRR